MECPGMKSGLFFFGQGDQHGKTGTGQPGQTGA